MRPEISIEQNSFINFFFTSDMLNKLKLNTHVFYYTCKHNSYFFCNQENIQQLTTIFYAHKYYFIFFVTHMHYDEDEEELLDEERRRS